MRKLLWTSAQRKKIPTASDWQPVVISSSTYPGELTTRTADLTTSKCVWNSVLSTKDAEFMGIDIRKFYLGTPLERYEYMKLDIKIVSQHVIDQYSLLKQVKNGFVHVEIR